MILIALGASQPSKIGLPAATLRAAVECLEGMGVRVVARSRLYSTPAWPDPSDPPFVNAAVVVETSLEPASLMAILHDVEDHFGRERRARNAPRTLDLDLIDYDGRIADGAEGPILPHPRAHERAFVLVPLLEIAPDWQEPRRKQSGQALLKSVETPENRPIPLKEHF